ncbi:hypothetical protein [Chromobacterium paludis]|uniref:hypothetical protein n=1 Tax=Chromobacterium paludis TaxID=2605945 RepID=UPI00143D2688|nr:hypothetical protein [Chromobacterium paludis]
MQNEKQVQEITHDQEIADVLGISVLSPLEEVTVSGGGSVHVDAGSVHAHVAW